MEFTRNNLDKATSPYLRQHQDNPIWWQEWNKETLDEAKNSRKIIFVSVGYATCHWCHVMANEVFCDTDVADYLNEHFISVKVDREQRPDIDAYLMSFLMSSSEGGGWPLNVFLTSDIKPIFATTYAPVNTSAYMTGFLDILDEVKSLYNNQREKIQTFSIRPEQTTQNSRNEIIEDYVSAFDIKSGGFGDQHKFPSFCALLFLLYYFEITQNLQVKYMINKTLDQIMLRGLHDHLQGGFFRYCIDQAWTIPHFEKMLYDQALGLWVYSLAFQIFKNESYKTIALKIVQCLEDSFESDDGVYFSAHDADTDHIEGGTYLWNIDELKNKLSQIEYELFEDVYDVDYSVRLEGKVHLIKKKNVFLPDIETKLLYERRNRKLPMVDEKIITSWNCLAGIAFIHAHRYLPDHGIYISKAEKILKYLLDNHYVDGKVYHSSCNGKLQKEALFLEDYGALLLFLTYIYEETGKYHDEIESLNSKIGLFKKNNVLLESINEDFMEIRASTFDHPLPSPSAFTEVAIVKNNILKKDVYEKTKFKTPLLYDFHNIGVLMKNGSFHVRESPNKIDWRNLSTNTIQKSGSEMKDCYQGVCRIVK